MIGSLVNPDSEYVRGLSNARDVEPQARTLSEDGIWQGYDTEVEDAEYELLTLADGSEVEVPEGFDDWTKTAKCKYLSGAEGLTVNQIAKGLGIRYQQVRQAVMGSGKVSAAASCSVCGRPLRDEKSVALGIGPICRGHMKPVEGGVIHFGESEDTPPA